MTGFLFFDERALFHRYEQASGSCPFILSKELDLAVSRQIEGFNIVFIVC